MLHYQKLKQQMEIDRFYVTFIAEDGKDPMLER